VLRKKVLLALSVLRHDVTIQTLSILNPLKRRKVTPLTIVFNHTVRVRDRTTTPLTVPSTHKGIGETSSEHQESGDEGEEPN
jgi:ACT domain-containing protein